MNKSNRRYISLSGWEGSGKSQSCMHVHSQLGFFMIPEIARVTFPINDLVLGKPLEELSEQTFTGYIMGHHFCVANGITHAVQDRCILDPLTYQLLYSPHLRFDNSKVQAYIDYFNEANNQTHLIDTAVLLRHPKDENFIRSKVFADADRQYSKTVNQYKSDALKFEEIFCQLHSELSGVAKELKVIDAYPENTSILDEVTLLAAGLQ